MQLPVKLNQLLIIQTMKAKELEEAVQVKNAIIHKQSRRIALLEEKFSDLRRKYFEMKYNEDKVDFHLSNLSFLDKNFSSL